MTFGGRLEADVSGIRSLANLLGIRSRIRATPPPGAHEHCHGLFRAGGGDARYILRGTNDPGP